MATTASAQPRTIGSIEFKSCDIAGPRSAQTLDAACAHYDVLEDPGKPDGRKISLNLALVPSRSAKPAKDLVVLLAGGPGQGAVDAFATYAGGFQYLLKDHDVLLVDQRGTGGSNRLQCPPVDARKEIEQTLAAARAQAEACLASLKDRADPRFYTTTDAIRDLETLRHALGDPQYDLVGASYGTRVAFSYLQSHPDSLRSLIVDGVVAQDAALGQDGARDLDDGLAKIFAACRDSAPCAARFGDPAKTLLDLRTSLRAHPMPVELRDPVTGLPRTEPFGELYLVGIVRLLAYQPEISALLPLLIDEAKQGRPQALLAQGLIAYRDLDDQLAPGMGLSVICTEDEPFMHEQPQDEGRLLGNLVQQSYAAQCAVWPAGTRPTNFKQAVVSDKPVLLLSGEWDPVTPPSSAATAAKGLSNSRQLVAKGRGHTVLWRGCMPKIAAKFIETLQPAALDVSCMDAFGITPAFTSYLGAPP